MTDDRKAHGDATPLDSPPERPGLLKAVRGGRRQGLEALRDFSAVLLEAGPEALAPSLIKQLREILTEIDQLPDAKAEGVIDELDRARAARLSAVGRSTTPDLASAAELLLNGGR